MNFYFNKTASSKRNLKSIFTIAVIFFVFAANAQDNRPSKVGWLYIENSHSFNDRWKLNTDLHLRSLDDFAGFGDLLFRNWLDYQIVDNLTIGAGYTYLGQWNSDYAAPDVYYAENRLFQQVQHGIDVSETSTIKQRVRLEQRFFNTPVLPDYSLRSRYALNWKKQFSNTILGIDYLFLENELFFNMVGRSLSGNKLFEQNRAYGGFGFEIFGNNEIELGSYYQIQNDAYQDTNHSFIFQLRIKTNL